jgi:hypothetical protein
MPAGSWWGKDRAGPRWPRDQIFSVLIRPDLILQTPEFGGGLGGLCSLCISLLPVLLGFRRGPFFGVRLCGSLGLDRVRGVLPGEEIFELTFQASNSGLQKTDFRECGFFISGQSGDEISGQADFGSNTIRLSLVGPGEVRPGAFIDGCQRSDLEPVGV